MDILGHATKAAGKILEFFPSAAEVMSGRGGIAIAGGVHPQNAIVFGEPGDDLLLAEGIARPVVAETDDVMTFDHAATCLRISDCPTNLRCHVSNTSNDHSSPE